MKTFSTPQAARLAGIGFRTLHRWKTAGKVRPSQSIRMKGHRIWRWTAADVERVKKWKKDHYRKGRGRPKPKR